MNAYLTLWYIEDLAYLSLRNLMRRRYIHPIISFLVAFVVSLGICLAGGPVCPDCGVVPSCCTEMDDNPPSGTGGTTADHFPGRSGCSHDGICFNSFQSIDASADSGTIKYDSTLVLFHLNSEGHPGIILKAAATDLLQSAIEKFPPLYLRICSFLI